MLSRLYIEALLVDEEAADYVLRLWNDGIIDDQAAMLGWELVVQIFGEMSDDAVRIGSYCSSTRWM